MIFADLQAGQAVFLDANVFVYHSTHDPQYGAACTDLLDRCERQEIGAFTSTHVVSEAAHRLMTLEACALLGRPQAGIAQFLRKHPAEVRKLTGFRKTLEGISQSAIQILTIAPSLLVIAALISQQTGLLHNDAMIVALMQTNGLANLASNDDDFDHVLGITRYSPC
jgi:predicted nucleic acid-binding protein